MSVIICFAFRVSARTSLLPLHLVLYSGGHFNIRCCGTVEFLRTLRTLVLARLTVLGIHRKKNGLHLLLVVELTTSYPSTLKHYVLACPHPRAFTGVRKHGDAVPGAFAHRPRSFNPVLPSVFHDKS